MAVRRSAPHDKRGPVVWAANIGASTGTLRAALAPWAVVRSIRLLPPPKAHLSNTAVREADVEVSTMREVQALLEHAHQIPAGPAGQRPRLTLSPMDRTMRIELSERLESLEALTWDNGRRRLMVGWTDSDTEETSWAQSLVRAIVSLFTTSFAFRSAGEQPPAHSLDSLAAAVDITLDSLQDALVVYSNLKDVDSSLGIRLIWPKRNAFAPSALGGLDLPPLQAGVVDGSTSHGHGQLPNGGEAASASEGRNTSTLDVFPKHELGILSEAGWFQPPRPSEEAQALGTDAPLRGRPTSMVAITASPSRPVVPRSVSFHVDLTTGDGLEGWIASAPSSDQPLAASALPIDRRTAHYEFWQSRRSQPIEADAFFGQVHPPSPPPEAMQFQPPVEASGPPVVQPTCAYGTGLLGLTLDAPVADERSLRTIWVGLHGALPGYSVAELETFFLPCGAMEEVCLPSPLRTSKMYAFITFLEYHSAVTALTYTGTLFRGTQIKVRPKTVWRVPVPAPSPVPISTTLHHNAVPASPPYTGAATLPPTPAKAGRAEKTPHRSSTRRRSDSDPGLRGGTEPMRIASVPSGDMLPGALYVANTQEEAQAIQRPPRVSTPKAQVLSETMKATTSCHSNGAWALSPPLSGGYSLPKWPWLAEAPVEDGGLEPLSVPLSAPLSAPYLFPTHETRSPCVTNQEQMVSPGPTRDVRSAPLSPALLVHPDGSTRLVSPPGAVSGSTESGKTDSSDGWTLASAPRGSGDGSKRTASPEDATHLVLASIPEAEVQLDPSMEPEVSSEAPAANADGWVPPPGQEPAFYGAPPGPMFYPPPGPGVHPYPSLYPPPFIIPPGTQPPPGFPFGPYGMPAAPLGPHMMPPWWPPGPSAPPAQLAVATSPHPHAAVNGLTALGFSPGLNPAFPLAPSTFPPPFPPHHPYGFSPQLPGGFAPLAPAGGPAPSGPAP